MKNLVKTQLQDQQAIQIFNDLITKLSQQTSDNFNMTSEELSLIVLCTMRSKYEFNYRMGTNLYFGNDKKRLCYPIDQFIASVNFINSGRSIPFSWSTSRNNNATFFLKVNSDFEKDIIEKRQEQERKDQVENFNKFMEDQKELLTKQLEENNEHLKHTIKVIRHIYTSNNLHAMSDDKIFELIILTDNIDRVDCLNELKSWLHSHNKTTKKCFEYLSGYKLHATDRETCKILECIHNRETQLLQKMEIKDIEKFLNEIKFNEQQTKEKQEKEGMNETFYKNMNVTFEQVKGKRVNIDMLARELFVTIHHNRYAINDIKTGLLLHVAEKEYKNIETFLIDFENIKQRYINMLQQEHVIRQLEEQGEHLQEFLNGNMQKAI